MGERARSAKRRERARSAGGAGARGPSMRRPGGRGAALAAAAALLLGCGAGEASGRGEARTEGGADAELTEDAAGAETGDRPDPAAPGGEGPAGPGSEGADTVPDGEAGPLHRPGSEATSARAPEVYRVVFATTEGDFTVRVRREWAPRGADRFYNLARHGFYDGARFFRVVDGFVAQFGLSGEPRLDSLWRRHAIPDDPVRASNGRGTIAFASSGEDTRTTQLFVNLRDNSRLDALGFAPIGRVVEGMDVVDQLYAGYGEGAPRGAGPSQERIVREGNAYLEEEFPKLDYVEGTEVLRDSADGA